MRKLNLGPPTQDPLYTDYTLRPSADYKAKLPVFNFTCASQITWNETPQPSIREMLTLLNFPQLLTAENFSKHYDYTY